MFGPLKGKGGDIGGKTDEELINDLISIHNAENWLGIDGEPSTPLNSTPDETIKNIGISGTSQEADVNETISEAKVVCEYKIKFNVFTNSIIRQQFPPKPAMNHPIAALTPAK